MTADFTAYLLMLLVLIISFRFQTVFLSVCLFVSWWVGNCVFRVVINYNAA